MARSHRLEVIWLWGVLVLLSLGAIVFSRSWMATIVLLVLQSGIAYTLGRLDAVREERAR
jgi:hypothetical protein